MLLHIKKKKKKKKNEKKKTLHICSVIKLFQAEKVKVQWFSGCSSSHALSHCLNTFTQCFGNSQYVKAPVSTKSRMMFSAQTSGHVWSPLAKFFSQHMYTVLSQASSVFASFITDLVEVAISASCNSFREKKLSSLQAQWARENVCTKQLISWLEMGGGCSY